MYSIILLAQVIVVYSADHKRSFFSSKLTSLFNHVNIEIKPENVNKKIKKNILARNSTSTITVHCIQFMVENLFFIVFFQ